MLNQFMHPVSLLTTNFFVEINCIDCDPALMPHTSEPCVLTSRPTHATQKHEVPSPGHDRYVALSLEEHPSPTLLILYVAGLNC